MADFPGIVPNVKGRRGPTGIIATNLYYAKETVSGCLQFHIISVASISEDLEKGVLTSTSTSSKPGREGLLQLLDSRNVRVVPFSDWEKIDTEEKRLGRLRNKQREKLTTCEELQEVAMK
ncbi:unnamed protein product [Ilex paraguariensis]|uniref:Uncharacterized protein n=1 Tax=Ilex paraguariensis TaxID=185542 RepID=A0ABC8SD83_9AQUA